MNDDLRVLFIDQTAALGGAEFSLRDIVAKYRNDGLVVLFEDGPLRSLLEADGVRVEVLKTALSAFRRESRVASAFGLVPGLAKAVVALTRRSRDFDVLFANTQKAMLVGSLASGLSRTPLVFHLHDILNEAHFARPNRWLSTRFANRFCKIVIADSEATKAAFIASGGRRDLVSVAYYGFEVPTVERGRSEVLDELGIDENAFVVGHFSRLSPWKGQEVLVDALAHCPPDTHVLLVGEAIFGEEDFVAEVKESIEQAERGDHVTFAGFRTDVADLMAACDLVVHSSTAPEPFGRVIVEAMLCGTPVVAADAGGPREILRDGETGWLTNPGDAEALGARISALSADPVESKAVASAAFIDASERFSMEQMHRSVGGLLRSVTTR